MYLTEAIVAELEARWGRPWLAHAAAELTEREMALIRRERARERAHDVTLLIQDGDRFAVMRKHSYPPGLFRPPSGGVLRGESVEDGCRREAHEETGLDVALERYLLRIAAQFTCGDEIVEWTTHIFHCRTAGGSLQVIDAREILEVSWATLEDLTTRLPAMMRAIGIAGMLYRAELQEATLAAAGLAPWPPRPPRIVRLLEPLPAAPKEP